MKYFLLLVAFILTGCATMTPVREYDRVVDNRGLVSKELKPAWIDKRIEFNKDSTFATVVGVSRKYSCERSAIEDAKRNALDKLLELSRRRNSEIEIVCHPYSKQRYIERHELLSQRGIEYYYIGYVLAEIGISKIERR